MKRLLPILLLILILGVWGLIKGYKIYEKYRNYRINIKQTEKGLIRDIELKNLKGGKVNWILKAKTGRIKSNRIFLNDFRLEYRLKSRNIVVVADRGIINRKTGVGIAQGNVRVILKNGVLKTDKLVWNMRKDVICSRKNFIFKGKFMIVGRNFCVYPRREFIKIKKLKKVVIE